MKIYLTCFFALLFSFATDAQNNSRVVFYWPEAVTGSAAAAWNKELLMRDDTEIAQMEPQSVIVYDNATVSGSYHLTTKAGSDKAKKAGLAIYPREHSITFIRLVTSAHCGEIIPRDRGL